MLEASTSYEANAMEFDMELFSDSEEEAFYTKLVALASSQPHLKVKIPQDLLNTVEVSLLLASFVLLWFNESFVVSIFDALVIVD